MLQTVCLVVVRISCAVNHSHVGIERQRGEVLARQCLSAIGYGCDSLALFQSVFLQHGSLVEDIALSAQRIVGVPPADRCVVARGGSVAHLDGLRCKLFAYLHLRRGGLCRVSVGSGLEFYVCLIRTGLVGRECEYECGVVACRQLSCLGCNHSLVVQIERCRV